MKKILIIHESLGGGGAERVLIELLNNINYSRYHITLLTIKDGGIYKSQLNKNVIHKSIYKTKINIIKRILTKLKADTLFQKLEVRKIFKNETFDVTISFMEGLTLKYHSLLLQLSPKNITWVHADLQQNHWSKKYFNKGKEEYCYNAMDKIVFVSSKARDAFNSIFNINHNKEFILYNIIDKNRIMSLAKEKKVKKKKFTLCCVGRLIPIKRYDRVINAAKLLKEHGCTFDLWIIGTGILRKDLEFLVNHYELTEYVHFLGFQSNPYPFIKAADVFIISSDAEGYPTVACEALT